MVDFVYNIMQTVGFHHPLHPGLTHIPMGMVIGCFFFGLVAMLTKSETYRKTSLHCSVLALIFIAPTIIAGVLDWQYYFGGTFSFLITLKFILGSVLTGLLAYAVWASLRGKPIKHLFIIYALCLACAGGLGFSGGELVYGG